MHNGGVGNFPQIRVGMLNEMSAAAQQQIFGTTDSEVRLRLAWPYVWC
jgi:hypothetical protein